MARSLRGMVSEGIEVNRDKAHVCGTHSTASGYKLGGGWADLASRHGHDVDDRGAPRGEGEYEKKILTAKRPSLVGKMDLGFRLGELFSLT